MGPEHESTVEKEVRKLRMGKDDARKMCQRRNNRVWRVQKRTKISRK